MKIKINVVNDNEETSVQDNDITEYRNSIKPDTYAGNPDIFKEPRAIGQPVHPGDVLLVKVKDKLFKCEIIDTGVFRKFLNLFEVHIYPLDKDDKELLANDRINRNILKRNYMDGTLVFDIYVTKNDDNYPYHEVDYTKGKFHLISPSTALNAYEEEFSEQPFTVVKFLTKSVPSSSVQDNDLTEYRNSIKPGSGKHPSSFKKPLTIGNPVHTGDVLLIKAKDKLFKCEIIDYKYFNESPNLFSVKIYPLDKDDKLAVENDDITHNVLKENYLYGVITFDTEIKRDENRNRYWGIDFTKGEIQTSSTIDEFKDFSMRSQPFTVVKFLTRSVPASTVQDHNLDLTYISKDLNRFVADCLEFKELVEDYKKTIEECIEDDQRSVELDGYDGEDPVESPNKKYLEMITFCIDDVTYNIDELIDQIKKR
ncbi:MAG: hypothetical protein SPI52_05530 [Bacilli bacterium]|nr:hypothetical protein [Bacilli bacterium]